MTAPRRAATLALPQVLVLWAVVAMAGPWSLLTSADVSGTSGVAALTVIAVALAAVVRFRAFSVVRTLGAWHVALPPDSDAEPVMTRLVTDPIHHPLRPRAPGQA